MQHNTHKHTHTVLVHSVCLCVRLFFVRALREDHLDKVQWALFERCLSNADAHTCICMHTGGGHSTHCVCLQPPPEALHGGSSAADRRPCCKRTTQTSEAWVRSELTLLRRNNLPPTLFGPFPSPPPCFVWSGARVCIAEWEAANKFSNFASNVYSTTTTRTARDAQGMKGRNGSFEVQTHLHSKSTSSEY